MARVERVVWDTNVAISLLQNEQGRLAQIEPYIEQAEAGELQILFPETSVVELHNLRGLHERGKAVDEIRSIIRDFLDQPYLLRRPLHRKLADTASEPALVHRITTPVSFLCTPMQRICRFHILSKIGPVQKNDAGVVSGPRMPWFSP